MKNQIGKAFFLGLLLTSGLFFSSCKSFKPIEYQGVTDWEIQPKSLMSSDLSAKVTVYNPNAGDIKVRRIDASIMVDEKNWGTYTLDSSFVIAGKSSFSMPISVKVNNMNIVSGGVSLSAGKVLPYQLIGSFKGSYRGISATIPFDQKGSFSKNDIKF
jgi:LEA14-like dessication related protein